MAKCLFACITDRADGACTEMFIGTRACTTNSTASPRVTSASSRSTAQEAPQSSTKRMLQVEAEPDAAVHQIWHLRNFGVRRMNNHGSSWVLYASPAICRVLARIPGGYKAGTSIQLASGKSIDRHLSVGPLHVTASAATLSQVVFAYSGKGELVRRQQFEFGKNREQLVYLHGQHIAR